MSLTTSQLPIYIEAHLKTDTAYTRVPLPRLRQSTMMNNIGLPIQQQARSEFVKMTSQTIKANQERINKQGREGVYTNRVGVKNEPQGSFNMPLNLNGNTSYGKGAISGGSLFRTNAVQQYYDQILKDRAEQLKALQETTETGQSLQPVDRSTIASLDNIELVRLLIFEKAETLSTLFVKGDYASISTKDTIDLLQDLVRYGLSLDMEDLNELLGAFDTIIENIQITDRQRLSAIKDSILKIVLALKEVVDNLIQSFNMNAGDRKLSLQALVRRLRIRAVTPLTEAEQDNIPAQARNAIEAELSERAVREPTRQAKSQVITQIRELEAELDFMDRSMLGPAGLRAGMPVLIAYRDQLSQLRGQRLAPEEEEEEEEEDLT